MVLVCNDRGAALEVVYSITADGQQAMRSSRMGRFRSHITLQWPELRGLERYQTVRRTLAQLNPAPELDLHDDNPV